MQAFHDRFLSYGSAPATMIRRAMLGANAGPPLATAVVNLQRVPRPSPEGVHESE
jgi:hypothetical protein